MPKNVKPLLWTAFPALIVVCAVWMPLGFSLGAMIEEWDIYYLIQTHPNFWNSFPGRPLAETFAARPLQVLPHFLAHAISGNSFDGLHIIAIAGCAMRIVGAGLIGFALFRSAAYAMAFAMLAFVFPADTQQFEFRTIHILFACGMSVLAAGLTVEAFLATSGLVRWTALAAASALALVAVLIYEPYVVHYLLAPWILLLRLGGANLIRLICSHRAAVSCWLLAPGLNIAYLIYAIVLHRSSYQDHLMGGNVSRGVLQNLHFLIETAAFRVLFDGWREAWQILTDELRHPTYLGLVALALVVVLATLGRRTTVAMSGARLGAYVVSAVLLSAIFFAPFLVSDFLAKTTQRTLMALATPASIAFIAIIVFVFQRHAIAGAVAAAVVVMLGLTVQIYQFDRYTRYYMDIVLPYTSKLADEIDRSKQRYLVFDRTGFGSYLNGIYNNKVAFAPLVRLRRPLTLPLLCMDGIPAAGMTYATCTLQGETWTIRTPSGQHVEYPASTTQVIAMGPSFDPSYRSRASTWIDREWFSTRSSMFRSTPDDQFICEADSTWGYSGFCRGVGWSDGSTYVAFGRRQPVFSAVKDNPTLLFDMRPSDGGYALHLEFLELVPESVLHQLRIEINGASILSPDVAAGRISARISGDMLRSGLNEIALHNAMPSSFPSGILMTKATLLPTRP